MLRNAFKVALRQLARQKLYSSLNIVGLSIALGCVIMIGLFVHEEFGYDRFHENADRIYRLTNLSNTQTDETRNAAVQFPIGELVRNDFGEIQRIVRIWKEFSPLANGEYATLRVGDQQFKETGFIFADSTFWDVFSFELLRGNERNLLRQPYEVVLTESTARKYFGDEDPVGKTMTAVDKDVDVTVAGVMADPPENSHLKFDIVGSWTTLEQEWLRQTGRPTITSSTWTWTNTWVYALLEPGVDPRTIDARMGEFVERNLPDQMQASQSYGLQAITDIHFDTSLEGRFEPARSRSMVFSFAAVGVFLLLIAAINFTNLAIANSMRRVREVGVRKSVGASRLQLMGHVLGEAVLLSLIAGTLSILLAEAALPFFNAVVQTEITLAPLVETSLGPVFAGIVLFVGVLAGLYPALVLTSAETVAALSGRTSAGGSYSGGWVRKGLVVTQFTVTVALLIATMVVYSQVRYLETKDLGINTEDIVMIDTEALRMGPAYNTFVQEALRHGSVTAASTMESVPGRFVYDYTLRPEGFDQDELISIPYIWTDSHFFDVFDLEVVMGSAGSVEPIGETAGGRGRSGRGGITYVINETAAERLEWDEPLGKRIFREQNGVTAWQGEVTGVVKDFHFRSLHQPIEPLIIAIRPQFQPEGMDEPLKTNLGYGIFRVRTDNVRAVLDHLEATWQEVSGGERAFRHFFLDEDLRQLYQAEERISRLVSAFAVLAVVIACLGLFGLASVSAEQRTKEIGIRKVLGASVADVVRLLSSEFVAMIAVAIVVATPVAYLLTEGWLSNFAYRIEPGAGLFVAAAFVAVMTGTVTVGVQAIRAALANPVESLRAE